MPCAIKRRKGGRCGCQRRDTDVTLTRASLQVLPAVDVASSIGFSVRRPSKGRGLFGLFSSDVAGFRCFVEPQCWSIFRFALCEPLVDRLPPNTFIPYCDQHSAIRVALREVLVFGHSERVAPALLAAPVKSVVRERSTVGLARQSFMVSHQ